MIALPELRRRLRRLTSILSIAVFVLAGMMVSFTPSVTSALELTSRSDTLSTSAFSSAAKHTFVFTTGTALTTDGTSGADFSFVINLPTNAGADPFTLPNLAAGDITATCTSCSSQVMAVTAAEESDNGGAGASDELLVAINETGQDSNPLPANSVVTLTVGVSSTQLTNPADAAAGCTDGTSGGADVCSITIHTSETTTGGSPTAVDRGDVLVALNDGVTVTATVEETLSFSIDGLASGSCTGDTGSPTVVTTTDTSVPFATLSANAFKAGCQTLTTSTNAGSGYSIVASENTNLKSGSNYIIDTTCDSACTKDSGTAWATASANQGFGYTCENGSGSPCATAGDSFTEYRQFACTGSNGDCNGAGTETPVQVATKTTAQSANVATIHYKISIPGSQAAAANYSNTITYVATPTF